jgi:hypothetical protein
MRVLFRFISPMVWFLLLGCYNAGQPSVLLCTDKGEFAAYLEAYNASQEEFRVEILFCAEPAPALTEGEEIPDIVIGRGLNDPHLREHFDSLDSLFDDGKIDPNGFYSQLLSLGRSGDTQRLLPLNFDLPVVVFKPEALREEVTGPLIQLDFIKRKAMEFNRKSGESFSRMGFSPLWNNRFLYYVTVLMGADFRIDEQGSLEWEEKGFEDSLSFLRDWLADVHEDPQAALEYERKYMKAPEHRLLEEERILFYLSDIKSYMQIPEEKRENLDIRWLSLGNRIPVLDGILFAGIPKTARNKRGALAVLEWLFLPQVQQRLLQINHFKRLPGVFGIANGFSSLIEVNERDLTQPQFYPIFVGLIPTSELFLFPSLLPWDWNEIRDEIVLPWLVDSVFRQDGVEGLAARLERPLDR